MVHRCDMLIKPSIEWSFMLTAAFARFPVSNRLNKVNRHGLTLLLAGALGASVGHAQASDTYEKILANGMKIIVKEDHRAPTVAHMVWYRVGSMDEKNGTTGVAHALEHMMFKGTDKLAPGEFSKRVAALGGRENAFTNKDYTAYFQQVHQSRLPDVMQLEADRMKHLKMSEAEFAKEIKVIMEERRLRTDDKATSVVYEEFNANAFIASPYRRPVIGWMNDLENMTAKDAADWYHTWYAPNNAVMVVTGDVQAKEVFMLAEKFYGAYKTQPLPVRKPQIEPEQKGERRIEVKAPAENPYVLMGYQVPRLQDVDKDDDVFALEILSAVLDGYDNARINRNIVRDGKIATDAGVGYDYMGRGPALFLLEGSPAEGKTTADLEKALLDEIKRVASDGVSEAELKRVKAQLLASQIYKRDSIFGQAMEIGAAEMSGYSWRQLDQILARLKAVTPEQVQAVAGKYFKDDTLTVATLLPQPITNLPKRPAVEGLRH